MIRLLCGLIAAALVAAAAFWYDYYYVRRVYVEGSTHYTDEEIGQKVMSGFLGHNSLVLGLRYRDKPIRNIPFIESMDVAVMSRDTIRITVYERSLAGYVNYLGRYLYFSRDGTVVESSGEKLDGIPEVTGLSFDHIALNEKLPVADDTVFDRILNITQLLGKYSLLADRIFFDSSGNASLFFGNIRVNIGSDDYLDEKIASVQKILPSLTDQNGTLEMSTFTPESKYITFTSKDGSIRRDKEGFPNAPQTDGEQTGEQETAPETGAAEDNFVDQGGQDFIAQ